MNDITPISGRRAARIVGAFFGALALFCLLIYVGL